MTYSEKDFKLTVKSEEGSEGKYKAYLVATVSEQYQWPTLQSVAPVTITMVPRPKTAPSFSGVLPTATFQTGKDGLLELPLSAAIDAEGDAFTSKVEIESSAS